MHCFCALNPRAEGNCLFFMASYGQTTLIPSEKCFIGLVNSKRMSEKFDPRHRFCWKNLILGVLNCQERQVLSREKKMHCRYFDALQTAPILDVKKARLPLYQTVES